VLNRGADQPEGQLAFRLIRNRNELESALRLVHENYVRCGYMKPQPSGLRINIHYALPTTQCFIAVVHEEIFATVSLFLDSSLGLPVNELYPDKLAELRLAGRNIAEVGMLADRRRPQKRSFATLLRLMKRVFWSALEQDLDDLLITINPKHAEFYQRMLCFESFGPQRSYPSVGGAPATLLRANLADLDPNSARDPNIRKLFLTPLSDAEQQSEVYRLNRNDLRYFFLERSSLFRHLTPDEVRAIEEHHPDLDVAKCVGVAAEAYDRVALEIPLRKRG